MSQVSETKRLVFFVGTRATDLIDEVSTRVGEILQERQPGVWQMVVTRSEAGVKTELERWYKGDGPFPQAVVAGRMIRYYVEPWSGSTDFDWSVAGIAMKLSCLVHGVPLHRYALPETGGLGDETAVPGVAATLAEALLGIT